MKYISGLVVLFVFLGPLYIGIMTLEAFFSKKGKTLVERTAICREPKTLVISIALLLLIPAELIYATLTHAIPDGKYTLNVEYYVVGYEEVYDVDSDEYYEEERCCKGIAPADIIIDNQVEVEDRGENSYGQSITKTIHYTDVYLSAIELDCFDNETFDLDYEVESNHDYDFEIEYDGVSYLLNVAIGDISDNSLGYTLEDRISGVSTKNIVEHSVLMLLDIIGIVGYFMAIEIEKKDKTKACE